MFEWDSEQGKQRENYANKWNKLLEVHGRKILDIIGTGIVNASFEF